MIGELEFSKVDVAIHEGGSHLRPSEVAADISLAVQRIRIGPSLTPAAFDIEIGPSRAEDYIRQLKAICRLARLSTVSILTLAAAPVGAGLDAEVRRLRKLLPLVEA